ncbi:transposase, partial [Leptolyngbya sp. FACHB-671]|uniref:transposase n=1 Tax=Leptolyngbya sp. FACHB-671 TaxID=2692812 RepID=UPI001F54CCD7
MKDIGSLLHSKWECKYHVYSFPNIDARRFTVNIEEGHLMVDHVHVLISIPPKYSVSQIVGFIALREHVRTGFESCIYTIVKTLKLTPSLSHPVLEHKP